MKIIMLTLCLLLMFLNTTNGQSKNFIDQPYIETSATVDTFVSPDRIILSILISENDTKGRKSVEELELEMTNKLGEIGIELDSQLFLSDLTSNFRKYFLRKQDILKAKSFELLVYDAQTAGRVIHAMEEIGISNVDLDRTEFSKIEALKVDLKANAVRMAKRQADIMIKSIGQTIGKAIFISDVEMALPNVLAGTVAGVRIRGASSMENNPADIPIEFEKIKVEARVNVKFAMN